MWLLSAVIAGGCSVGDPGYVVAARNESDVPLVIRGDSAWLLPAHSGGILFATVGPPREARPIDFEVLDQRSCAVVGLQRMDFTLAPDPGFSQFILVVQADRRIRIDALAASDPELVGSLDPTAACP